MKTGVGCGTLVASLTLRPVLLLPFWAGSSVVDWLVFMQLVLTRVEAATLASALLEEGFLRPLGFRSVEALRSAGLSQQFLDDSTALYGFVSVLATLERVHFIFLISSNASSLEIKSETPFL